MHLAHQEASPGRGRQWVEQPESALSCSAWTARCPGQPASPLCPTSHPAGPLPLLGSLPTQSTEGSGGLILQDKQISAPAAGGMFASCPFLQKYNRLHPQPPRTNISDANTVAPGAWGAVKTLSGQARQSYSILQPSAGVACSAVRRLPMEARGRPKNKSVQRKSTRVLVSEALSARPSFITDFSMPQFPTSESEDNNSARGSDLIC